MLTSSSFYLIISFLGFLGLLYRYAYSPFIKFLDDHRKKIKKNLDEAWHRHEALKADLESEMEQAASLDQQVMQILEKARHQSELLRQNIQAEVFSETVEQENKAQLIIDKMQHDFIYQLRDEISDRITLHLQNWIKENGQEEVHAHFREYSLQLLKALAEKETV